MDWYKLIFKQNQPIHIGSAKWGVVKETDIFISGQTMWGALTNTYIKKIKEFNNKLEEVQKIFEQISNFFPSLDGENILKPSYKDGKFHLGDFSEDEFKAYFVDTLVQTAIEPINRKAKDESLHEIDYILPKPKAEFREKIEKKFNITNLHWIGIINISEEYKDFFKEGLKIYIGADSRYGYGELELVEIKKLNDNDKNFWWLENGEIEIKENQASPYFIELSKGIKFKGEILLLSELDFLQNTPVIKEANFFINVGSKIEENINKKFILKKGKLYHANST